MNRYIVERTVRIEQKQIFYNVGANSADEACANVRDGWMEPDETEELDVEPQDDEEVTETELGTEDFVATITVEINATSREYAHSILEDTLGIHEGDDDSNDDDSYQINKINVEVQ